MPVAGFSFAQRAGQRSRIVPASYGLVKVIRWAVLTSASASENFDQSAVYGSG